MKPDKLAVGCNDAAKVLRPRPVQPAVDYYMADPLLPQLLTLLSVRRRADSDIGWVINLMSRLGSMPTWAAILARKVWCGEPSSGMATVLPLRSRIACTRSVPNSS